MIIRHFLKWVDGAPVAKRQLAAAALARAWLQSDLPPDERAAAEAALTLLTEDPSPKVRAAIAEVFSLSGDAPTQVIEALADDQIEVSALVLSRSPLLSDPDLIDRVAIGGETVQRIIASRPAVSRAVSAAVAEVAALSACIDLLRNSGARIAGVSFRRLAERLGHHPEVRSLLLDDARLPVECRHVLMRKLGEALVTSDIVSASIGVARAAVVTEEACARAAVELADGMEPDEVPALVEHLRLSGELTTAFVIRAVAFGRIDLFAAIVVALSGQRPEQVRAVLVNGRPQLVSTLLHASGLAESTHAPLAAAIDMWRKVARGKIAAGPREATRIMIASAGSPADRMPHANDDLSALLRTIHMEALKEDAHGQAVAIAAA
jgi:uncharacterized protein (DUF2336 family)